MVPSFAHALSRSSLVDLVSAVRRIRSTSRSGSRWSRRRRQQLPRRDRSPKCPQKLRMMKRSSRKRRSWIPSAAISPRRATKSLSSSRPARRRPVNAVYMNESLCSLVRHVRVLSCSTQYSHSVVSCSAPDSHQATDPSRRSRRHRDRDGQCTLKIALKMTSAPTLTSNLDGESAAATVADGDEALVVAVRPLAIPRHRNTSVWRPVHGNQPQWTCEASAGLDSSSAAGVHDVASGERPVAVQPHRSCRPPTGTASDATAQY